MSTTTLQSTVPSSASGSAVVKHLASYPTVNSTIHYISSIPIVKKAVDVSKPYVEKVNEKPKPYTSAVLERAQPALDKADQIGDKVLSNIDARFPSIKTVQPSDVVSEVRTRVDSAKSSAQQQVDQKFVKPLSSAASSVKERYSKVYDAQGKPIVDSIGSRIAPLNDKLESVISEYLPAKPVKDAATDVVTESKPSNEFGRSASLFKSVLERLVPVFTSYTDSAKSEVSSVYSKKLSEQKDKPKYVAELFALFYTGLDFLSTSSSKAKSYASAASEKASSSASSYISSAKSTAQNVTSDAQAKVDDLRGNLGAALDEATATGSDQATKAQKKVQKQAKEAKASIEKATAAVY